MAGVLRGPDRGRNPSRRRDRDLRRHDPRRDVPHGEVTDFYKAAQVKDDETPIFSWIEYPDRATRDAANKKMREDPEMANMEMPFDGARMFWGGFEQVVNQ